MMKTVRDCILLIFSDCLLCDRDRRICISPGTVCESMAQITLDMILKGEY